MEDGEAYRAMLKTAAAESAAPQDELEAALRRESQRQGREVPAAASDPELTAMSVRQLRDALDLAVEREDYREVAAIKTELETDRRQLEALAVPKPRPANESFSVRRRDGLTTSGRPDGAESSGDNPWLKRRPVSEGQAPGWQPPDEDNYDDPDAFVDERWA